MRHTSYLILFLAVALLGLGAVAGFHIYTDSNCVFAALRPGRYDQPRVECSQRVVSAERIRRASYEVILLGSSRTRHGFNDDDPAFGGRSVYNFSMEGTSIGEIVNAMRYIRSVQKPKLYLIGLDFGMFDLSLRYAAAERGSLVDPQLNLSEYYLRNALGDLPNAYKNWTSIAGWKKPRALWTREGMKVDVAARLSKRLETSERWFKSSRFTALDLSRLDEFRDELGELTRDGARVIVFVPPVHASLLHQTFQLHQDVAMRQWISALADMVQAHNLEHPSAQPIELWDFTGFNVFTTESLDPITDPAGRPWFYECSHMTPNMGALLLSRMLGQPQPSAPLKPEEQEAFKSLGSLVTPESVPLRGQQLDREYAAWRLSNLRTIQLVSRFLPPN